MKILKFLGLVCIVLIIIHSCEHEPFPPMPPGVNDTTATPIDTTDPNDTTTNPNDTTTSGEPCDPDTVYFGRDILPILSANCAFSGCHDAGTAEDGVILDSYINVMTSDADVRPGDPGGSDLYEMITENDPDDRMPPPPNQPLSASEIQLIRKWILQGAQNLTCDDCDTADISFSIDIQPIFHQSCTSCHGGSAPTNGISLETYNQITNAINTETLIQSINHQPGYTKMPLSGIKLDQCKLDKINFWVNAGMPNN